ncbi:MAG: phosphate ABC transporter permease subunit PstC [Myxococcaceae bacterium]
MGVLPPPPRTLRLPRGNVGDRAYSGLLLGFGAVVLLSAALILGVLWLSARPALAASGTWDFIAGRDWDPVQDSFGALPFIYGTVVTSVVAVVLAVPVGVGLALFLTEMAPRQLRAVVAVPLELLAAIPSVVYGLWGIFVLVPWLRETAEPALGRAFGFLPLFQGPPLGLGYLAAGLILAVMILPTITSISIEVLRTVPGPLREAAFALGATRWEAIRIAVLPYARDGILGAVLLGLGRALGETMAVTMVIGNSPEIHASLFAPGYTLPSIIANEFAEATGDLHTGALAALGLILFAVTILLNAMARILVRAVQRGPRRVGA